MIREAVLTDGLELMRLGAEYIEEMDESLGYDFDMDFALQNFFATLEDPKRLMLVSTDGSEITGMLWAIASTLNPWSQKIIATPHLFYVTPSRRGSIVAYKLLKGYEEWAKKKGAYEVQISVASGIHTEKTERFYERMGYENYGRAFRRVLWE